MARARDIANIINSGTFITPASASATYLSQSIAIQDYLQKQDQDFKLITNLDYLATGGSASISNGQITFTSVSSISAINCFSTNYSSYKIIMSSNQTSSVDNEMRMRFRNSLGDITSGVYNGNYITYSYLSTTSSTNGGAYLSTYLPYTKTYYASSNGITMEIFSRSNQTEVSGHTFGGTASQNSVGEFGGRMSFNMDSVTGITFYCAAATSITGRIKIYGYK
jgi:hypothetical protein